MSKYLRGTFLTPASAAEKSGYNLDHIRRLAKQGAFESVKVGHNWLIVADSFAEFIAAMNRHPDRRFGPRL